MPNHLKFCGCKRCRAGMHSKSGSVEVQKAIRKQRRKAKEALRNGKEPEPKAGVPYTD